jgi:hypothetical protein
MACIAANNVSHRAATIEPFATMKVCLGRSLHLKVRPGKTSMESERWRQIESLYYNALERDATERAAFLMEMCADDDELRREVESLLAVHEQAEDFMAAPALEVAAQVIAKDQG